MLFAVAEGMRGDDPTANVKPPKMARSMGHMTWLAEGVPRSCPAGLAAEAGLRWWARRREPMEDLDVKVCQAAITPTSTYRSDGRNAVTTADAQVQSHR